MKIFLIPPSTWALAILFISGCATMNGTTSVTKAVSGSQADAELRQDYTAKSRDLNKKLRAEWVEISSHDLKACIAPGALTAAPATGVIAAFDKTKAIDSLKNCIGSHSWLIGEQWAQVYMENDVNSPWGPYFMSLVAEGRNQILRAQWMIDLAIARAPQIGGLVYQKARLFWKIEDYRDALAFSSKVLDLDPEFAQAAFMVGQVHYRDREYKEAFGFFKKALTGGMQDGTLSFETAEVAGLFGQKEFALQNYKSAATFGLNSKEIREKIAGLEKEIGADKLKLAAEQKAKDIKIKQDQSRAMASDVEQEKKK